MKVPKRNGMCTVDKNNVFHIPGTDVMYKELYFKMNGESITQWK